MKNLIDLCNGENGRVKVFLFHTLKKVIDDGDIKSAEVIFTSVCKDLQEVLGTWVIDDIAADRRADSFTFLTFAILLGKIDIAQAILENASDDVLTELLSIKSIIQRADGTKKFTALSFAEKEGYTDLAKKIEAKMEELELLTLVEESLDEDDESLWSTRGGYTDLNKLTEEKKKKAKVRILTEVNKLQKDDENFWSPSKVYTDLAREARETIEGFRVEILGTETQEELKNFHEKNKEMIKEIQTAQAVKIAIFGFMMVALAVAAIATIVLAPTAAPTIGIVTAGVIGVVGLTVVGFAGYHGFKEIPDTQVEEVGANDPAQLLRE